MKTENRNVGRLGEQLAEQRLSDKGYQVIERNFRTKFGEIDLICRDGECLVFVEVKTKRGLMFGTPEEMFTKSKFNKVKRMATVYLKGKEVSCRVDMVAVILGNGNEVVKISHYPNVFI